MAKNVVINGVTYQNVPEVDIPIANSNSMAEYHDTSDATLDGGGKMLSGVTAYADGVKYTGTIPSKTGSDLTASGDTVTVPAGHYASQQTKAVASGSAAPATTINGTGASVSTGNNTLTLSKSVSNTPQVSAGYVASGTAGSSAVSLTASVPTKGAATIRITSSSAPAPTARNSNGTDTMIRSPPQLH